MESSLVYSKEPTMNQRIAHFELLWARIHILPPPPLIRANNLHHLLSVEDREQWAMSGQAERDALLASRFPLYFVDDVPPPEPLVRLTNQHELLSGPRRIRWWDADSQEERAAIMAEEGM